MVFVYGGNMVESGSNGCVEFCGSRVSDIENQNACTINKAQRKEIYSYDEALELAGHGKYNIGVLLTLCLTVNAMIMDLFGFSLVVNGASSDFKLEYSQKSFLLTIPLIGTIIMAYPWGYIADTQGRKKTLVIAICGSFVSSVLSAFSINWIMLAILKLLSSSFSGGIQSIAYTLMGELSITKYKNIYILILSTVLMSGYSIYSAYGYFALRKNFSLDLGLITFTPWRLFALILASTLGTALLCFGFVHESPKYLLNAGRHKEALDVLRRIYKTNGGCCDEYPAKKIVLNETCSFKKGVSLLQSLKEQTIPLFKPPLLLLTLQLYYIIGVIYLCNNGLFLWLPFLAESFFDSSFQPQTTVASQSFNDTQSLCGMIGTSHGFQPSTDETIYISPVNLQTLWTALTQGAVFTICNLLVAKVADRRKPLLVGILLLSSLCGAISVHVMNRLLSVIFFFGILLNSLCIGVSFSYFLDLYPTSYRGMVSCLGMMVARSCAIAGVHLLGLYIVPHCAASFYSISIITFSAAVVSMLLPPDTKKV